MNFVRKLTLELRAIRGRAFVRVVSIKRDIILLPFQVILPVLGVAAYIYLYRFLGAPPEFGTLVLIGGVMTTYWLNILWSMASQLYWERMMGNLELYFLMPASKMSILLGMALGGMYITSIRALSTLLLGLVVFRLPIVISNPIMIIILFLLSLLALYGMGMLLSSVFLVWGREAWHLSNLFQEPIYLISGFYFPVKSLGFTIALIASFIPVTLALDGMRQLLIKGGERLGFIPVWQIIIILGLMAVIFPLLAFFGLYYMEKLAKRAGRITIRWQ